MEIKVPTHLISSQDFEAAVRCACDELSAVWISNYFHDKKSPPLVELVSQHRMLTIAINCKDSTVILDNL